MTEFIIEKVSQHTNVSRLDMCSQNRKAQIVRARHLAFYFIRKYTGLSNTDTGRYLFRDHSTVTQACASIRGQLEFDSRLRKYIEPLENEIKNALTVEYQEQEDMYMENDFFN